MNLQQAKAESLLKQHQEGSGLLLPNAWDVASARIFEQAGFGAIGTTSAGIAFAQGYPDGQQISRAAMLEVVARIAAAVEVPVTADIEAGYGESAEEVAKTVAEVIATGAVGINLEDSTLTTGQPLFTIEEQSARIAAAREQARQSNVALVINARIDAYLLNVGEKTARLPETLERARAYLQAGADSIFVPGVIDPSLIKLLVEGIPGPLNLMISPGTPPTSELFKLGVRRVSTGASVMLATMGLVREIARELHEDGTYHELGRYGYKYSEAGQLFQPGKRKAVR